MKNKPTLGVIFLTVLVDLIGFGIVLPLLPVFTDKYSHSKLLVGLIMASYSAMQFFCSPLLGRLSDRIGRRPVILASTATAAISYAIFAWGCHIGGSAAIWIFLISRIVAGACGANIVVAQAYIADITPPEKRSKSMGLIGMAFGLGFTIGPSVGSFAVGWLGTPGLGIAASAICAINFITAFFILKESWTPSAEHVQPRPHWEQWKHTLQHPVIGVLVLVYFLTICCFACFETTLGLLVSSNFSLDPLNKADSRVIGYLFTFGGLMGAAAQGGLTGRLITTFGETKVIALSLLFMAIALVMLPFANVWSVLLIAIGLLSLGSNLNRPPLFGMISKLTPASEQGATIGVAQGAGSLARIVGPILAGGLMQFHLGAPYLVCGGIALFTCLLAGIKLPKN
jgi:DHA1 family tetracycline resistance protein-like MFS transporter